MAYRLNFYFLLVLLYITTCQSQLPTLYEYYTEGGINSGLVAEGDIFTLNGKEIRIFSGSIHYFRVHPGLWRDRLRKARACGLNAIETYVPWNLHEPMEGIFDFGDGSSQFSQFLNVSRFLEIAQEEDLFVIFRPGPYICSEWDFGGLPSWLMRDPAMFVRSSYPGFLSQTELYFNRLLDNIKHQQFSVSGGPVIAVQVENEYAAFGYSDHPRDKNYLVTLKDMMLEIGITELLLTSDAPSGSLDWGAIPGVLQTANFQWGAADQLGMLKNVLQPDRPLMVMEFWTGWFLHWLETEEDTGMGLNADEYEQAFREIMVMNSSLNMYMFHGGTNFGFMSGANDMYNWPYYGADTTSYDYDAPLSEGGDYTEKYYRTRSLIEEYNPVETMLPEIPNIVNKTKYPDTSIHEYIDFHGILAQLPYMFVSENVINMELFPINNDNGQSYGYALYRATVTLTPESKVMIRGHVRDMAMFFIDGILLSEVLDEYWDLNQFGFWPSRDSEISLPPEFCDGEEHTIDFLVENLGRVNYGQPYVFLLKKGLWEGDILLNRQSVTDWTIYPVELLKDWVTSLTSWSEYTGSASCPCLFRGTFNISSTPTDTYLDARSLTKGVAFINGFNIGRYWTAGPQQTLYIPAPLLVEGQNEIIVFEQYTPWEGGNNQFWFSNFPIWEIRHNHTKPELRN